MKTITVKQPWAWLQIEGIKDIENRTWPTNYRGRVLIHAAAKSWTWNAVLKYLTAAMAKVFNEGGATRTWLDSLTKGAIVGSVEIVDCVINHPSIWAERHSPPFKPYNWVLSNPIKFPEPIPAKGKLSFWDYPAILAEPEEKNGELFCHCQLSVDEKTQVTGDSQFGFCCRYCGGKWYK
jgi:hypothetical protein